MRLSVFFILILLNLPLLSHADFSGYPLLAPLNLSSYQDMTAFDFKNSRGQNLSVVVYETSKHGSQAEPLVIIPGLTETALRYGPLAKAFAAHGYGPIYILEHINQGQSDNHLAKKTRVIDIHRFDDYVDDFIEFVDGPLKEDLEARGIDKKPNLLAHSMGGAIANLALLKRSDLVDRAAYIAPMFQMRLKGVLKKIGEKRLKTLLEIACFRNCGSYLTATTFKRSGKDAKNFSMTRFLKEAEYVHGIATTKVSLNWVNAAMKATEEIRNRASDYNTRSLIYMASDDELIENSVFQSYVCQNKVCSLIEVRGSHSPHLTPSETSDHLVSQISTFLRSDVTPNFKTCEQMLN